MPAAATSSSAVKLTEDTSLARLRRGVARQRPDPMDPMAPEGGAPPSRPCLWDRGWGATTLAAGPPPAGPPSARSGPIGSVSGASLIPLAAAADPSRSGWPAPKGPAWASSSPWASKSPPAVAPPRVAPPAPVFGPLGSLGPLGPILASVSGLVLALASGPVPGPAVSRPGSAGSRPSDNLGPTGPRRAGGRGSAGGVCPPAPRRAVPRGAGSVSTSGRDPS